MQLITQEKKSFNLHLLTKILNRNAIIFNNYKKNAYKMSVVYFKGGAVFKVIGQVPKLMVTWLTIQI